MTGIILVNYLVMVGSIQEESRILRAHSEEITNATLRLIDNGLEIYDNTLNDKMRAGFDPVMSAYNMSGGDISLMNFTDLRVKTGGMGVHLINRSAVIVGSDNEAELYLDFSVVYPDFARYLKGIINHSGFFPDRVSMEYYTGNMTKYGYMPTPDHQYIIELSMISDDFTAERSRLNYTPFMDQLKLTNPDIEGYRLFAKNYRLITNTSYIATKEERDILGRILSERKSFEFSYPEEGKIVKYLLVDMRNERYAADKSVIVEITYRKDRMQENIERLLLYHVIIAIIAVIAGAILSLFISRRLTRPVEKMVRDVDHIAAGDLDHTISSGESLELITLQESVNRLVISIRGLILNLKEEERKAVENEERYRGVVESQTDLICRYSPDRGNIFVNDAYCRFFNTSSQEILGSDFRPILPDEDRDLVKEFLGSLTPMNPSVIIDHRVITKDQSVRWIQWSIQGTFNEDGSTKEYQCVGRDITGLKVLEENLRASDLLYHTTIDAMVDLVHVIDRSYTILLCNRGLDTWMPPYLLNSHDVTGKDLFSVFPFLGPDVREEYDEVFSSGEVMVTEESNNFGTDTIYTETRKIPVLIDGTVEKVVTIVRNITKKKQTDGALLDLNRRLEEEVKVRTRELEDTILELDSFSYTVSHDLRAPIRAVDGFSYILSLKADPENNPDLAYYIEKIHENIRYMDRLIDDLLRFSRMSRYPIEGSLIDMKILASDVIREISALYSVTHFDITLGDLPPALGDPVLIRQVFINLVSNAMKFSQKNPAPRIEIGFSASDGIEYYVQDNGIGFDIQYADKIFDVFQRLHLSDEYDGTGVGLAIVKRIVTRHGGHIRVWSAEGVGSTFSFTLGGENGTE